MEEAATGDAAAPGGTKDADLLGVASAGKGAVMDADLRFWFDPVCPFAWMTSKWVRIVAARRDYTVEWRPVSLRLMNAHIDYDSHFPPEYEASHTAGLRLLRVCVQARDEHGPEVLDRLYLALGTRMWEAARTGGEAPIATRVPELATAALADAALPASLADAVDDPRLDAVTKASTDEALALTGKDVGTPILHFEPPQGVAFFGPVISRIPAEEDAVALWDNVIALARFAGFAEFKRSLRELPQLPALGVADGEVGVQEDWHAGSRRQKR